MDKIAVALIVGASTIAAFIVGVFTARRRNKGYKKGSKPHNWDLENITHDPHQPERPTDIEQFGKTQSDVARPNNLEHTHANRFPTALFTRGLAATGLGLIFPAYSYIIITYYHTSPPNFLVGLLVFSVVILIFGVGSILIGIIWSALITARLLFPKTNSRSKM